ncbi:hypothetical protein [Gandjariella thermophila]|uniref:hypothetical protein n=1 Tax=Gandjariella thermophila TaxID=1931992 RepID=UPI001CEF9F4A|nr:hypothetical protein [Gandjariella thermophila]
MTVQRKGIGDEPGTRLSTERARTSWKVTPSNSGVRTVRTSPGSPSRAGSSSRSVR